MLSKQEEISAWLEREVTGILVSFSVPLLSAREQAEMYVRHWLYHLNKKGVVIKVDKELPLIISRHVIERICGETAYLDSKTLGNAGYVAVEPLIEEK